jgi:NhaA family Na+:H+ antiporter
MVPHHGEHWWERDWASGALLAAAAALSFAIINSPIADGFAALIHTPIIAGFDIAHAVNDGLMAIFFLYVGLELKRESVEGPLKNPRVAALPIASALGGMAAPALVFLFTVQGADQTYARGWAIPAATDIAFALGVLSLAGKHAPVGLRLFLLTLAIVDDLGAILIVAVFYSTDIVGWALGGMALTFGLMLVLNGLGERRLSVYWVLALVLWVSTLASGIHATIAGVLAALTIPMRDSRGRSPVIAAEHSLKPWVLLLIMPVFALTNAGAPLVGLDAEALMHPVTRATALGLFIGKPVGVAGVALVAAAFMHKVLPAPPLATVGAGFIAGVGLTMSLFIGALAFDEGEATEAMRIGVIVGSVASAVVGLVLIRLSAIGASGDPELAAQERMAVTSGVLDAPHKDLIVLMSHSVILVTSSALAHPIRTCASHRSLRVPMGKRRTTRCVKGDLVASQVRRSREKPVAPPGTPVVSLRAA